MSPRILATILCCAALYLVGNGRVSLWDRDEPRYAQASRQMLQSGDWVVPKLLDQDRINKPPLIYWCQATAMRFLGDNAMAARLPSSIAMTLTLILIATFVKRHGGEDAAFWTTLVFATSGLVIMAAKMCLTDAVLLLFVTASQFCLYAIWQGNRSWPVTLILGVSLGLAFLTKGPVVLGVNATTLLVLAALRWLDRRSESGRGFDVIPATTLPPAISDTAPANDRVQEQAPIRPFWLPLLVAFVIGVAIFSPWMIAMQFRLPGGLLTTFEHDVLKRMATPLEQHKGPPGYYLLFFLISFFPWCLFLPNAIKLAWQNRHDPLLRFSLAAVVGPWLMFEAIQTKLPHYVLPCFPFLAILTTDVIRRGACERFAPRRWLVAVGILCLALVCIGLGPWVAALPRFAFTPLPHAAMTAVTVATAIVAILIFVSFARGKVKAAALSMAGGTILVMTLLFAWYLPQARFLHLSEDLGAYLRSIGASARGQVQMIDYKEDSLPFYQGGTIRPQPRNAFLNAEPVENWPPYLTITREIWDGTDASKQARLDILKTFRGWAYAAKGRVVEVMVVKKK